MYYSEQLVKLTVLYFLKRVIKVTSILIKNTEILDILFGNRLPRISFSISIKRYHRGRRSQPTRRDGYLVGVSKRGPIRCPTVDQSTPHFHFNP